MSKKRGSERIINTYTEVKESNNNDMFLTMSDSVFSFMTAGEINQYKPKKSSPRIKDLYTGHYNEVKLSQMMSTRKDKT